MLRSYESMFCNSDSTIAIFLKRGPSGSVSFTIIVLGACKVVILGLDFFFSSVAVIARLCGEGFPQIA